MNSRLHFVALACLFCTNWAVAEEHLYRETRDDPPAATRARDNISARTPGARVRVVKLSW